ncbi:phospholipid scramblase 2-like isoform X2 [Hemicordylus capensis]|uniref:phospholipid scramblase 2-like isoform X2 n=1 Tax=Hemicordylus capensis TaxID=884348 RepID=UPI0023049A25|nr:phospholipid scramblase 2-like isoform X2 [Hemicordylus capensis]XP_053167037.1 phospholipid scramblase 2-like isoform X2 [Hemicordylus capensis]
MAMQPKESESVPPPPGYQDSYYPAPQVPHGFPGSAIPGQPGGYLAVQAQPNAPPPIIWMPAPPAVPKCPPGLEYLSQIDQISIEQQIELMEMISGYETANRYEIKNTQGQWVYFAAEENDDFTLNCYGSLRPFTIKLFDSTQQAVMQLTRSFQCSICCCPCVCCLQELEVQAPPGTIIGYVKQKWHPCLPKFAIQNEAREDVLQMAGPCVPCRCFQDIHFEVKSLDGKSGVGGISRQWTGLARETATDASIFGIQFPLDLDIKIKAIVMGAAFLMDYMFFERSANRGSNNRNRRRRAGLHGAHGIHGHRRR